jgi:UDP:flavonoid glycosyltransferase YjiC (YdhE family)
MTRPRVDLVSPPFCGHLHPLLGIGVRLSRDVDVRVVSTERAQSSIAASGLHGAALLAGGDTALDAIVNPPFPVRSHPLRLNAQLRANLVLLGRFRDELAALWRVSPPDLVLADFTVAVAGPLAASMGIPWWTTLPSPCVLEAPDGPPAYVGGWRPLAGVRGRVRDACGRALIRGFKRAVHRLYRERMSRLGFPALYRDDGSEAIYSPDRVFGLSLPELELARRWPRALELVGPVLYTPPVDAPAAPFRAGRRHVLVTLGTHLLWYKDAVAAEVRRAARGLPDVDLHFSDGDPRSTRRDSDGNFHRLGYVPYARDLARYDLVVHHGGTGVLHHALRAGRPALVLPVDYDQFDYAARLEVAGVARRVRRLSDLPAQIAAALDDAALADACRRFQEVASRYDAPEHVAQAVLDRLRA